MMNDNTTTGPRVDHRPGVADRVAENVLRGRLGGSLVRPIRVILPSGYAFDVGPRCQGPHPSWNLKTWNGLVRAYVSGPLGLGEGYINGDWVSTDLRDLLTRLAEAMNSRTRPAKRWSPSHFAASIRHAVNRNSRAGSRRNIKFHYDLGNAFYQLWLDPSMTYSSAEFETGSEGLQAAQEAKYRNTCEALGLKRGDRVLEIGCGWGGFAEFAVRNYGCHVTGITLSREQLAFAQDRLAAAGLSGNVDFRYQDYRDVDEQFDAIASIEMLEAVGEAHWEHYFEQVFACLKEHGRAAIQTITLRERDFAAYRQQPDFIQKYIFPGGMLPSNEIVKKTGSNAGLSMVDSHYFGDSYARTLRLWFDGFNAAWADINPLGFDSRFRRMWEFYLGYCEAGFATGRIDVGRFVFAKPDAGYSEHP
jgi:cyclopropane-fatty-acyl-phospholipid synthase